MKRTHDFADRVAPGTARRRSRRRESNPHGRAWQARASPVGLVCIGAEPRNRTGLAALEAQSFALNKPRVGGRTLCDCHRERGATARASTRSRRTESNRARSRTERLLHLGATTARLIGDCFSRFTEPSEASTRARAGARCAQAQPRGPHEAPCNLDGGPARGGRCGRRRT